VDLHDLFNLATALGAWIVLQYVILPRLGVPS
jgi:hypothetical protein